ncbi:hypothetical protein ACWFRB_09505 [Rhodococcus sp. NPDC055112]
MTVWHPWRHLRDHHPDLEAHYLQELPNGERGRWDERGVHVCASSNQRERRCTLTHELVHVERGPVPDEPHLAAREERCVDRITARRLITLDDLVDALIWNRRRVDDDTAEELWVDLRTLQIRIRELTDRERAHIDEELERRLS